MLVDAQTKTFSNPETFRIAFFVRDYLAGFEKKILCDHRKKKKKTARFEASSFVR